MQGSSSSTAFRSRRPVWLMLLSFWCLGTEVSAENASLLRFVKDDAAACVFAQDLDGLWQTLANDGRIEAINDSPIFKRMVRGPLEKTSAELNAAAHQIAKKSLRDIVLGLVGKSIVLALFAHENRNATGMVLSEGKTAKDVEAAIQFWHSLEPEYRAVPIQYQEQTYYGWSRQGKDKSKVYYYVEGAFFALTDQEDLIRSVIDRRLKTAALELSPKRNQSVLDTEAYVECARKLPHSANIYFYLFPRAWDEVIASEARQPRKPEGQRLFANWWSRCTSAGCCLTIQSPIEFRGWIGRQELRGDAADGRRSLLSKPTGIQRIPDSAWIAIAGQFHLTGLLNAFEQTLGDRDRKSWEDLQRFAQSLAGGRSLVREVLPILVGDTLVWLDPQRPESELVVSAHSWWPTTDRPRAGQIRENLALAPSIVNLCSFALNSLLVARAAKKSEEIGQLAFDEATNARWISGWSRMQPGFCWNEDGLLASSQFSTEFANRWKKTTEATHLARQLQSWVGESDQPTVLAGMIDVEAIRRDPENTLRPVLARVVPAAKTYKGAVPEIELFDRLWFGARQDDGGYSLRVDAVLRP